MALKPEERGEQEMLAGQERRRLPIIALRDTVVFPRVSLPIIVRRARSLKALAEATRRGRLLVVAAQKDSEAEDAGPKDIYAVGTLVKVREAAAQPDGSQRLMVDGIARVRIGPFTDNAAYLEAEVSLLPGPSGKKTEQVEALMYSLLSQVRQAVSLGANVPFDTLLVIMNVSDPWMLGDLIAANLDLRVGEKQAVLEADSIENKLNLTARALTRQLKMLQIASKIQTDAGQELDKMQREVFLREQLKTIEHELEDLGHRPESEDLKERIEKAGLPPVVLEKALKEYERLRALPSFSPELSYLRTYLEWLCDLPWHRRDEAEVDIAAAARILDEDHYGLAKVKERILEYLAVQKLVGKIRGPILCFAGPPGTGKTSVGKSIARALGRKFQRLSLGGVRDEAEIRGHRRTYVGALPGRIIQGINTAKTRNPVFMLDEIDKIGADFRGDPSAALLEALDPEQNNAFSDHYLEVPFDLSETFFITTANILDTVPPALRDRLEVIEFPGYTEEEKLRIAKDHLVPKTLKDNGLAARDCRFADAALRRMISGYTREAGVRALERAIAAVCRKIARGLAERGRAAANKKGRIIEAAELAKLLGPEKFSPTATDGTAGRPGIVTGLAWTEAGGDVLQIEAVRVPGQGKLTLTGHLGQVMQESAQTAFSFARSAATSLGAKAGFDKEADVHIHVPAGAVPKDGPSAGAAMATALVSMLTGAPVRSGLAMTGEVTLHGRVLEIGGVKEKVLAAHRYGIRTVILPAANKKDLVDVPAAVRKEIRFVFAADMSEVLKAALERPAVAPARRPSQAEVRRSRRNSRRQ
ncbi:MAG: endopeptidase La [Patescibacteria group bacterium]|jgi:ATP-dependent Lon protease